MRFLLLGLLLATQLTPAARGQITLVGLSRTLVDCVAKVFSRGLPPQFDPQTQSYTVVPRLLRSDMLPERWTHAQWYPGEGYRIHPGHWRLAFAEYRDRDWDESGYSEVANFLFVVPMPAGNPNPSDWDFGKLELRVGRPAAQNSRWKHPSLVGGNHERVLTAGTIGLRLKWEHGRVKAIKIDQICVNDSGHYEPHVGKWESVVRPLLQAQFPAEMFTRDFTVTEFLPKSGEDGGEDRGPVKPTGNAYRVIGRSWEALLRPGLELHP